MMHDERESMMRAARARVIAAARSSVLVWGVDFWRAFAERPLLLRLLARAAMGRYAWRELIGLREALGRAGMDVCMPYGLEGMDYHRKPIVPDGMVGRIRRGGRSAARRRTR